MKVPSPLVADLDFWPLIVTNIRDVHLPELTLIQIAGHEDNDAVITTLTNGTVQ
jgi:hypothetical protein